MDKNQPLAGFCPALEQYPLYFIKNDKNLIFFQVIIQITSKHKFWTIGHLVFGHPWWNEAGTKCKCQLKARAKVSLLGVESHCTFIPTDWGSYVFSSRFVLFCSFWRLFTIKMIKSVKIFPFSFWKIITTIFFLLHKIQTPGINMQNGRQVI